MITNTAVSADSTLPPFSDNISEKHWYVAIVRPNTEKKVRDILERQGYEVYLASQQRLRITPSGRKKWIEHTVISSKIFVYCNEKQRLEIVKNPYIHRFLTNPSLATEGRKKIATISQKELDLLRFMLNQSDFPVDFINQGFKGGDRVKIIRGSLKGLEGEVIETNDNTKDVVIFIDLLGSAKVTVPSVNLKNI